ncbi:MAG: hypothetical protein PHP08_00795 [Candidatus Dojkabacteria bacterium]|nr:hypothetical protein [Candidatus Dojkabacteria bacterium]
MGVLSESDFKKEDKKLRHYSQKTSVQKNGNISAERTRREVVKVKRKEIEHTPDTGLDIVMRGVGRGLGLAWKWLNSESR